MYEVEIKVRADHDAVRRRLEDRGATALGRVTQADTYYDAPHREFAETDEALRVRRETERSEGSDSASGDDGTARRETEAGDTECRITYKGPKVDPDSKTREEVETAVGDGEVADAVFRALGFDPAAEVRKDRERYELDGYTVTLDSVEGAGEFVEVETEAEDVDPAREGAEAVMEDLGLDPDAQIRTSYLGLLLDNAGE